MAADERLCFMRRWLLDRSEAEVAPCTDWVGCLMHVSAVDSPIGRSLLKLSTVCGFMRVVCRKNVCFIVPQLVIPSRHYFVPQLVIPSCLDLL